MEIDKSDPRINTFLQHVRSYCKKHNKNILLKPSKRLRVDGEFCSGWCDGEEIQVASRHPLALEVLVHEFGHMTQAVEDASIWKSTHPDCFDFLTAVKNKKSPDLSWSWEALCHSFDIERDCEIRTIKLIRKFQLPIDITTYIKAANLYFYYYHYVFLTKRWVDSSLIYQKALLEQMPHRALISSKQFRNINMNIMQSFHDVLSVK